MHICAHLLWFQTGVQSDFSAFAVVVASYFLKCYFDFFGVVIIRRPSSKQGQSRPCFFASSCAAWTFGGWKPPPPPIKFVIFPCHTASEAPPPLPSSSSPWYFVFGFFLIEHIGKWTATKSFLAIILYFWPRAGNPILSQESCVWRNDPSLPHHHPPTVAASSLLLPSFLVVLLHIHVCLNADGIKGI